MQDEGPVLRSLAIPFSGKEEEREEGEEEGGDLQDIEGGDLLSKKHDELVKEEGVDMLNIDRCDLNTVSCDLLNIGSSDHDQQGGDLLNNEAGGHLLNLVLKWKERKELEGGSTQAMQVFANSLHSNQSRLVLRIKSDHVQ